VCENNSLKNMSEARLNLDSSSEYQIVGI